MLSPLLIDTILLDYHLGHALLLGFVLSLLGAAPLKSQRVCASVFGGFGLIFIVAPYTTMPPEYILLGIPLVIIGALLWTMSDS